MKLLLFVSMVLVHFLAMPTMALATTCEDFDADGICDFADNCTETPNFDQIDTNGDGYGNACDTDFDNNGMTAFSDVLMLKAAWGSKVGDLAYDADCDVDSNGAIGGADWNELRRRFGTEPGPAGE